MTGVSSVQLADRQVLERNDGAQVCWLLAGELLLCALRALLRGATHMWRSIHAILHHVCAARVSSRLSAALGTGKGGILVYHQIITKLNKVEHAPARPCSNPCPARFPRLLQ